MPSLKVAIASVSAASVIRPASRMIAISSASLMTRNWRRILVAETKRASGISFWISISDSASAFSLTATRGEAGSFISSMIAFAITAGSSQSPSTRISKPSMPPLPPSSAVMRGSVRIGPLSAESHAPSSQAPGCSTRP